MAIKIPININTKFLMQAIAFWWMLNLWLADLLDHFAICLWVRVERRYYNIRVRECSQQLVLRQIGRLFIRKKKQTPMQSRCQATISNRVFVETKFGRVVFAIGWMCGLERRLSQGVWLCEKCWLTNYFQKVKNWAGENELTIKVFKRAQF